MKITKKAREAFVRGKLKTDSLWITRAIKAIYELQTDDEKAAGRTGYLNGVGFSGVDSEIMSSFAEQFIKRGFLSPKQMSIAKGKIHKYSKQIIALSDEKKLDAMVAADLVNTGVQTKCI